LSVLGCLHADGCPDWCELVQVPLADGILGEVEEISCAVGDVVNEGDPLVVIETHKASLFIKAEQFKRIRVTEILVAVGQEVRECQPMVKAVPYPA
jgi:pyruvate/2-oxoglutarate dehydrogenase complex dihydrolipoamide acyltransferase (E2) component